MNFERIREAGGARRVLGVAKAPIELVYLRVARTSPFLLRPGAPSKGALLPSRNKTAEAAQGRMAGCMLQPDEDIRCHKGNGWS